MTFTYLGRNLTPVPDAFGSKPTLAYSGDKISMVSDSASRSVSYIYGGDNYGYDSSRKMTSLITGYSLWTEEKVGSCNGAGACSLASLRKLVR